MANTVETSDIDTFLTDTVWAICSTYHRVLKASPGAAIFGQDMVFETPFLVDWNKIGDHRECQTDLTRNMKIAHIVIATKNGDQVLLQNDGIPCKSESRYESDPWTITSVHTNGTIRIQCRTKLE
jgi:hypothetical protein